MNSELRSKLCLLSKGVYAYPLCARLDIDRFHSIFHLRNWRAKWSCDVDIDQSAGNMVM